MHKVIKRVHLPTSKISLQLCKVLCPSLLQRDLGILFYFSVHVERLFLCAQLTASPPLCTCWTIF